jgi:hypothetical protein
VGHYRRDTVCIQDIPSRALIREVLDLVLVGPIFHVDDSIQYDSRVVTITFFNHNDALAFYRDATENKLVLYGHHLGLSWGKGPRSNFLPKYSRAMILPVLKEENTLENMRSFGPIDRIQIVRDSEPTDERRRASVAQKRGERANIHFLSVAACVKVKEFTCVLCFSLFSSGLLIGGKRS